MLRSSGIAGLFGATSSFYSNLSQYSSIRSGAYSRATKAYYAKNPVKKTEDTSKNPVKKNQVSKWNASNAALSDVKDEAKELIDSAKKLTSTGKGNMFAKESEYDKDEAYKAVSSFVNNYNDTVSALGKTANVSVSNAGNSMTRMTNVMSKSLAKVGITVGTDGKMSVDEETFKKADMSSVKSLFNGNSSYASIVSSSASRIETTASNQITQSNAGIYGSNSYFTGVNTGSFFDSYF